MPIQTLSFEPTLRRSLPSTDVDFEKLQEAGELADAGQHLDAVHKVIEHFAPAVQADLRSAPFELVQGSSKVSVELDGDDLLVRTPLVQLPAGGRSVAAMRYLLERTSASGQLYQPRLAGDRVRLEYRDRLVRFHPAKLVEVLRKMPAEADKTDDWLIEQFGALADERAEVSPATEDEAARAWRFWQQHWSDCGEILKDVQRKRSLWFLNELTAFAINYPSYMLPLAGALMTRLEEAAGTFNDADVDPDRREASLERCIKEMSNLTAEQLKAQLGHATYAIEPRRRGAPQVLAHNIGPGNYMNTLTSLRDNDRSMEAGLGLFSTFVFMLARFRWPAPVEQELTSALTRASGKPWRELAKSLYEDAERIASAFADSDDDDDDDDTESDDSAEEATP